MASEQQTNGLPSANYSHGQEQQVNNLTSPTCSHGKAENPSPFNPDNIDADFSRLSIDPSQFFSTNIEIDLSKLSLQPCVPSGCRACTFEGVRATLTFFKRLFRKEIRSLEAQMPAPTGDLLADVTNPVLEDINTRIGEACADWHIKICEEQYKWEREYGLDADQDPESGQSVFEIHKDIIGRRWSSKWPPE